jgi:hypothetical protein
LLIPTPATPATLSIRTFLIAMAVLIAAASAIPLFGQEAMPPRFFIEKIEVREANRVSPEVVIAESRLREGEDYSESDLRDASARLTRLPFLLSAEFSLEKGSERGRYVLVVTINETKPFFYAFDLRPIFATDNSIEPDYSDRIGVADSAATLGMRWFVGRRGDRLHAVRPARYARLRDAQPQARHHRGEQRRLTAARGGHSGLRQPDRDTGAG